MQPRVADLFNPVHTLDFDRVAIAVTTRRSFEGLEETGHEFTVSRFQADFAITTRAKDPEQPRSRAA
jgi:hypothetical protein